MHRILFVCHGNICRSPMAEFVMKDLVRRAGCDTEFAIDSMACRTDEIGSDTYPGTKRVLDKHGIPYTSRKARKICLDDYKSHDYIIGMDSENIRDLMYMTDGDSEGKISLLMEWAGESRDVADPWYTGDFDRTYRDVTNGCQALLEMILKKDRE